MEKFIRDGKVAIILSCSLHYGWSTWGDRELAYDKRIVEWLYLHSEVDYDYYYGDHVKFDPEAFKNFIETLGYKLGKIYHNEFNIVYVPIGTQLRVVEGDMGSEQVEIYNPDNYFLA